MQKYWDSLFVYWILYQRVVEVIVYALNMIISENLAQKIIYPGVTSENGEVLEIFGCHVI